ncbi:MAG: hypothetical protein HC842_04590 [Cytophagales bacterium]|nr:hypothetical protein [Cytophagales bacterium]
MKNLLVLFVLAVGLFLAACDEAADELGSLTKDKQDSINAAKANLEKSWGVYVDSIEVLALNANLNDASPAEGALRTDEKIEGSVEDLNNGLPDITALLSPQKTSEFGYWFGTVQGAKVGSRIRLVDKTILLVNDTTAVPIYFKEVDSEYFNQCFPIPFPPYNTCNPVFLNTYDDFMNVVLPFNTLRANIPSSYQVENNGNTFRLYLRWVEQQKEEEEIEIPEEIIIEGPKGGNLNAL